MEGDSPRKSWTRPGKGEGMTDKEKQLAEKYPEASLIAEMAKTAWGGNLKAVP
jgi:hypothetical protein